MMRRACVTTKKHGLVNIRGLSVAAIMLVGTISAHAQTAINPPASTSRISANPRGSVEDIVVTARRRSERLQDVPVTLTPFTKKDLARYQTQSFTQLSTQTPNLVLGNTSSVGGGVINLRGVGSPSSGTTIDQAVSINVDGIQFSQANVLKLGLHDLDRIEVLEGPQALFYGKNSPAGVISIISANPASHPEASLRTGYEFANKLKYVEGTVSGPVTDTLGLRLDSYYGNETGWFRNDAQPIPSVVVPASLGGKGESTPPGVGTTSPTGPHQQEVFVRATAVYKAPDGVFDSNLKVSYGNTDRQNSFGFPAQLVSCVGNAPQFVLALHTTGSRDCTLNRTFNDPNVGPGILALNPGFGDGKQFSNSHQFLASSTSNYHPNDKITVTSVTGYYDLHDHINGGFSYGDLDTVQSASVVNIKQFSEEVRALSSFAFPLNFMVGGYFQHVDNGEDNLVAFDNPYSRLFTKGLLSGPILTANNAEAQKTTAFSFFGQAILDITPKLQLTGGGRYSQERKNISLLSLPDTFDKQSFAVSAAPDQRKFHNISPEATLTYKASKNLTFYSAFREGFQSGGFDLNAATVSFGKTSVGDIAFGQETVLGGEVGAKGSFADRQVTFAVSAYDYKYSDLQVSAFDALTLGYRITNAGTAIVKGSEISGQYRPVQIGGLTLRSAISYNDAYYGSFANAPCYTGQTPAGGCSYIARRDAEGHVVVVPAAANQVANAENLSGSPLTRSSLWSGNVGATYEYDIAGGYTLTTSADELYASSYFADPSHSPRTRQPAALRLNATVVLLSPRDRWEFAVIGTNLTQTLRSINDSGVVGTGGKTGTPAGFGSDLIGIPTDPRTIAVQLTLKY